MIALFFARHQMMNSTSSLSKFGSLSSLGASSSSPLAVSSKLDRMETERSRINRRKDDDDHHHHGSSNNPTKHNNISSPTLLQIANNNNKNDQVISSSSRNIKKKLAQKNDNDGSSSSATSDSSSSSSSSSRRYSDPVRKFHLEDEFGMGVKPMNLIPDAGGLTMATSSNDTLPVHSSSSSSSSTTSSSTWSTSLQQQQYQLWKQPVPQSISDHPTPEYVLTAYLEPLNLDEWKIQPLPNRSMAQSSLLQKVTYPAVHSCTTLPKHFPVDNTPAEHDPFLPWIHDVFPSADGTYMQIVAQNRRRCNTGKNDDHIMEQRQPQVALLQHVPIQRIHNMTDDDHFNNSSSSTISMNHHETRYRLTDYYAADPDGITTRFICRFKPSMEETLSEYYFDYDWIAFRKRYRQTIIKDDGNLKSIHTSQLIFKCPIPLSLQEKVRTGETVVNDWATLFFDIIPIRTPPRYGSPIQYLQPQYEEFSPMDPKERFNATAIYGTNHVLPRIEDSGRWENIPICLPSLMQYEQQQLSSLPVSITAPIPKIHRLVSCLWVSAGYTTRGERFAVNDGQRRLLEWMTYNQQIGFDHFYIYDNSGAFSNETTVQPVVDLFPGAVTYIQWPSAVCNNRPNNVDSPGERSSQYAAESSCRLRFGPHVEWIGQFDIDEYLVPMGDRHHNALTILDQLEQEDKRIVSFGSWRAWPRWNMIEYVFL
jgi:hypothetical protein